VVTRLWGWGRWSGLQAQRIEECFVIRNNAPVINRRVDSSRRGGELTGAPIALVAEDGIPAEELYPSIGCNADGVVRWGTIQANQYFKALADGYRHHIDFLGEMEAPIRSEHVHLVVVDTKLELV